jgi:LDH2 family malate/lactate/ureidoglycolate dehydrogenase
MSQTWSADIVRRHAEQLLAGAGLERDKAPIVAELLVEADLMGHDTHGLALLPRYLDEIASGQMTTHGAPEVLRDTKACITWDGRKLPGIWLVARALDLAIERVSTFGTVTVVIRNSHHIACLAAYLSRATDRGFMVLLSASDPSIGSVAPFGGTQGVFTPNPVAAGIPTEGDPILIDISASITTNGMASRLHKEGNRFPGAWALDAAGTPTDSPGVLLTDPPGTLLPTGGADHGHKGYGLALMVEALTQGLSGFGRADAPGGWGAAVFVQVFDPTAFGGGFTRQTSWLAEACRACPPVPGVDAVRLPGQRGLELKRKALAEGVPLYPGILDALAPHAAKFGVTLPAPHAA